MADTNDGTMTNTPEADAPRAELPKVKGNRILNWLLVRRELAQAEADAATFTTEQREFLRRAQLALELGELAFAPGNVVRAGSTAPLAANLFRQAMYWALLVQRPHGEPITPEQLWAEADRSLVQTVAGNEAELAYLTRTMRSTFIELADGTDEAQRESARTLRRAANRLVSTAQRVLWRLEWAKLKRIIRVASVVLVPALAVILLWPPKRDLGKGAAWYTSSTHAQCHPEKSECGGAKSDIMFHTSQDQDPWFEYDFATPLAFSSLEIRNRSECCQERAIPLVVEVSNDNKVFREVARRTDPFLTWSPKFPTERARYLRLRVLQNTFFHLEYVKVHP